MNFNCVIILVQLIAASSLSYGYETVNVASSNSIENIPKPSEQTALSTSAINGNKISLEPRNGDTNFVKDIVDRLHALDADIGKLLYNSTSMYAPNDQNAAFQESSKGGEKFTEVLVDLDSLQDEIGVLINNATRARQYNILVRLRPLNNILYRIRHNLHLVRNSLVAINTVSSLEKLGNSVLDSTLQAFMRPEANLNDELGDNGNYDIDLDSNNSSTIAPSSVVANSTTTTPKPQPTVGISLKSSPSPVISTPASTTVTTPTSTTLAPSSTAFSSTSPASEPSSTTEKQVSSTRRATVRPTRRSNQRQSQRRTSPRTPAP